MTTHRHQDWIDQARCDLSHARDSRRSGSHEWACFAAQQAAEKAIKGYPGYLGAIAWGHSLTKMLDDIPPDIEVGDDLRVAARGLDKHFIATRYPNGFDAGKPADYYGPEDSDAAIEQAERVLAWVDDNLAGPETGGGGPDERVPESGETLR